jgi:hypothetical protein
MEMESRVEVVWVAVVKGRIARRKRNSDRRGKFIIILDIRYTGIGQP